MIKIYTTKTCHYCKIAKEYFSSKSIPFEAFDVSTDVERRNEMIKFGYSSVPIIVLDGHVIVGFDKQKIEDILGL